MTTLRAVQLTESQKERRKRLVALANEALRSAGKPEQKFEVAYSALPTAIVMAIEHIKGYLDDDFRKRLIERFDAIIAEELAERSS
jgi:hypothetical protein